MSAPVLGFDLARLQGGALLADVLVAALALQQDDLDALAAGHEESASRAAAWVEIAEVAGRPTARDVLASGALPWGATTAAAPGEAASAAIGESGASLPAAAAPSSGALSAIRRIQQAPIGTLDRLLSCLREDVLDWTWSGPEGARVQSDAAVAATAILCDAAAAAYLYEQLDERTRTSLLAPWRAFRAGMTRAAPDLGPQSEQVLAFLDRVRTAGQVDMERVAAGVDRWRTRRPGWATAVHNASWAVSVTERVRPAALAQMLLVEAVAAAGWPLTGLAAGDWNVLSGAVHALMVRDVLAGETSYRLLAPCIEALGPLGPAAAGSPAAAG